jgi:hypothetical protein
MRNLTSTKIGKAAVALMLTLAAALALMPSKAALAGFVSSVDSQAQGADLDRVRTALENKKVSETLASLGYDRSEIDARLSQLDDSEIRALAGQLDQAMTPAGDSTAGVIIAVVVIFLVVLGVLSLMGRRVVVSE